MMQRFLLFLAQSFISTACFSLFVDDILQARASALEYLLDYSTALCGQVRKSSATTAEFLRLAAQLAADPNALRLELHQSPV